MALFGSSRPTKTKLSCFGKLPSYGDFISLNSDGPGAQRLSRWLQEGVSTQRTGLPGPRDQYHHFVWPVRGSRKTLIGVMWPSADAAGRRFPFAVFSELPTNLVDKLGCQRLIAAEPIWRKIHELFAHVQTLTNANEQYKHLQDAKLPPLNSPEQVMASHTERMATPVLQGTLRTALAVHTHELMQFADQVAQAPPDIEFAVRSKLHGQIDGDIEACSWLSILETRTGRREGASPLFVRVHPSASEQSLIEFRRDLVPTDLGFLLAPSAEQRVADHHGFRDVPANQQETRFRDAFVHYWGSRPESCAPLVELGSRAWSQAELDAAPPAPPESVSNGAGPNPNEVTGPAEGYIGEEVTGEIVLDVGQLGGATADPMPDSFPAPDALPELPGAAFDPDAALEPPTGEANLPEPDTSSLEEQAETEATAETPTGDTIIDASADLGAEPTTSAAAIAAPESETAATDPATDPEADTDAIGALPDSESTNELAEWVARIEELAATTLLAGRLIALGESDGSAPDIYVNDAGGRTVPGDERAEVEQSMARHAEAHALLERVRTGHAALEARLESMIREAADPKPAPAQGD